MIRPPKTEHVLVKLFLFVISLYVSHNADNSCTQRLELQLTLRLDNILILDKQSKEDREDIVSKKELCFRQI